MQRHQHAKEQGQRRGTPLACRVGCHLWLYTSHPLLLFACMLPCARSDLPSNPSYSFIQKKPSYLRSCLQWGCLTCNTTCQCLSMCGIPPGPPLMVERSVQTRKEHDKHKRTSPSVGATWIQINLLAVSNNEGVCICHC